MNWSNYGKWRHPKEWWELKQKTNNMDKVTEQLIRIEAKLELIIDMVKAKNKTNKEYKAKLKDIQNKIISEENFLLKITTQTQNIPEP